MKIEEMTVGQSICTDLILAEASIRKTKTNKDYLQATFSDGTESLDGKIWDYKAAQGTPAAKLIYSVQGTIGEFNGKKQLTISSMQVSKNQDMSRFAVVYMPDRERLWGLVLDLISTITDPILLNITGSFYRAHSQQLIDATSAKGNHHVGFGGNLQHSYEVALITDRICSVMANELMYEQYNINRDLAVAGALLHDIGKAWTYDQSTPAIDYNQDGRWFDHILVGCNMLTDFISRSFPAAYTPACRALCHIIASHHGEPEKGSPVYPNFMEAMIVSSADGISARLNATLQLNRKAEKEGRDVTDKAWTIGNYPLTLQRLVLPNVSE